MTALKKPIGVGLIGTGYMGKCHALAWNAVKPVFGDVPDIRLVHLGEVDEALAQDRAAAFGFERSSGDWRKVVDDPDVDVVSITTPNQFHAEMAIAALDAEKHVWCEKPMAAAFEDARKMCAAAKRSGKVAVLGYNYIQNPIIRYIKTLLDAGTIGQVNHIRLEMDEDFMADPETPFFWKCEAASGYGALDDFAVHPLSLILKLFGPLTEVMADMAKPYRDRPLDGGGRRVVETYDIASVLFRIGGEITGTLQVNRTAWGRKGRIALQIFGARGSILFDQERMNEVQLYTRDDRAGDQGYRTILAAPDHSPYDRFVPAPGHGLGFNDLKTIECRELIAALRGESSWMIDFEAGLTIEKTVEAMAASFREERWMSVVR